MAEKAIKENWENKLTDLIEEEIELATGIKVKEHFSGDCRINEILQLVREEIEEAEKRGRGLGEWLGQRDLKNIEEIRKEARKEIIEEIWEMLIESLPSDAENLSTASEIKDQSQRVLKTFLAK